MNDKDDGGSPVVYKCLRSIYGAKQAPRKFYNLMLSTLLGMNFVVSLTDPCLFVRNVPPLPVIVIVLIVDDLLELSPSTDALLEFEKTFAKVFSLSSTGPISWWNGIKVDYDRDKKIISLSQHNRIREVLQRFGMTDCSTVTTPFDGDNLRSATAAEIFTGENLKRYQSLVGNLMYISVTTEVCIQFAVNQCAAFMHAPGPHHWTAAERILR
jgi:hypothetical protein